MENSRAQACYRTAVTLFLVAVLGAQAASLLVTAQRGTFMRSRVFPILEYPMYAPAHYEGERVTASWLLEGVLADGTTIAIPREQLQVDIFDFVNIVQSTLQHEKGATSMLVGLVHQHVPGAAYLRTLRIKNYPVQLTRAGPRPMNSEVVMEIPLS